MHYLIAFLEGIITFISPCLLPMLPLYLSYFAGGGQRQSKQTLSCALGFGVGFTIIFVTLGALAGTLGGLLKEYQTAVNLVSGLVVIGFGLNFLGLIQLNLFNDSRHSFNPENLNFGKSILFGMVFAVGWTPCVGTFLGSALMLASQQGHALTGMLMLLAYSLGLGIPFVLSALLIDQLKSSFNWIKAHYTLVNRISGALLIITGLMMATGTMGALLSWFA